MSKHVYAFAVVFLCPFLLFAQSDDQHLGDAKYRNTFDYKKLAHDLTDGVTSDSLKVKSIYLWMTSNLDYDVYGFSTGQGSYTDPNQILKHRKTVCLGYSILFDSLCSVAGVPAETVFGYAYQPWYETGDTLFLDNHAWNVVQIDGQWEVLDVTWGSGYVKQRKQVVKKILYRLFRIPYSQRYRFIHKTNMKYYCTDPEVFVLDHLPSTPAWQLLDCAVPIDSFQRTPHATMRHLFIGTECERGMDSISAITEAEQQDHMFVQGKQALGTNIHNHQDISYGQYERLKFVIEMAQDTQYSIERQIALYDSSIVMCDSLIKYFKLTAKDAYLEGKFFDRRNRRMREQTTKETRPCQRKHKRAIDNIKSERFRTGKQIIKLKRENKRLRRESKLIRKKKIKIKRPPTVNERMSMQRDTLIVKTQSINDSVTRLQDSMLVNSHFNYEWEPVYYDSLIKYKKKKLKLQFKDMREVNFFRQMGYTCYDTCVFTPKNSFLRTQNKIDSVNLLLPKPGKWHMDSAARVYKQDAGIAKRLLRMNLSNYKQLARMPEGGVDEKALFDSTKAEIIEINDSLIHNNREHIRELRQYKGSLRKFRLMHYKVRWQLKREMKNEAWRYVLTAKFFRGYYRGVNLAFRQNANLARKIKSECKRAKKALQRKLARMKREEEKQKKKQAKLIPQN